VYKQAENRHKKFKYITSTGMVVQNWNAIYFSAARTANHWDTRKPA